MKTSTSDKLRPRIMRVLIVGIILSIIIIAILNHIDSRTYHSRVMNVAIHATLRATELAVLDYETDNLQLPDSLDILIEQTEGKGPYLKPSELLDPWGQAIHYSLDKENSKGFVISIVSPEGEVFENNTEKK